MNEQEGISTAQSTINGEPTSMSMVDFLENVPPTEIVHVADLVHLGNWNITTPEVRLHCSGESCNGVRFYRFSGRPVPILTRDADNLVYLRYRCSTCQRNTKIFSLWVRLL